MNEPHILAPYFNVLGVKNIDFQGVYNNFLPTIIRYKNENETMHYTLNLIVVNESSMKYKVSVFFGIQIGHFLSVWQPETGFSQYDAENVNSRIWRIMSIWAMSINPKLLTADFYTNRQSEILAAAAASLFHVSAIMTPVM